MGNTRPKRRMTVRIGIGLVAFVLLLFAACLFIPGTVEYADFPVEPFDKILSQEEIHEKLTALNRQFEQNGLDYLVFDPKKLMQGEILWKKEDIEGDFFFQYWGENAEGKLRIRLLKNTGDLVSLSFRPKRKPDKKYETGKGEDSFEDLLRKIAGSLPPGLQLADYERRPNQLTTLRWERTHLGYPCLNIGNENCEFYLLIDSYNQIQSFYKEWRTLPDHVDVNIGPIEAIMAMCAVKRDLTEKKMTDSLTKSIYVPTRMKLAFVPPNGFFVGPTQKTPWWPLSERRLAWVFELKKFPYRSPMTTFASVLDIYIDAETGRCIGAP